MKLIGSVFISMMIVLAGFGQDKATPYARMGLNNTVGDHCGVINTQAQRRRPLLGGARGGSVSTRVIVIPQGFLPTPKSALRRGFFAATPGALPTAMSMADYSIPPDTETLQDRHPLFTEILSQYVHDGRANYAELRHDSRLDVYLNLLSQTRPDTIESEKHRLAFWINAYNAFTLKIICDNYPVKSINDLHFGDGPEAEETAWEREFIEINGKKMSLDHIEHQIIRKEFYEPRIHFALVCAAVSCPPLRSEAYEGYKLDQQLDEQGKIFFSQEDKNRFDLEKRRAYLSRIMDWYGEDFGQTDEEVLMYVARFLPEDVAADIRKNTGEWKVLYTDYDWDLNE